MKTGNILEFGYCKHYYRLEYLLVKIAGRSVDTTFSSYIKGIEKKSDGMLLEYFKISKFQYFNKVDIKTLTRIH